MRRPVYHCSQTMLQTQGATGSLCLHLERLLIAHTSSDSSCTFTRCQSTNVLFSRTSSHCFLHDVQHADRNRLDRPNTHALTHVCNWAGFSICTRSHLLPQVSFGQMSGCVNLYCCCTLATSCWHSRHMKVARYSSGRTSLLRVTVPCMVQVINHALHLCRWTLTTLFGSTLHKLQLATVHAADVR
jgi:hypothetical protein